MRWRIEKTGNVPDYPWVLTQLPHASSAPATYYFRTWEEALAELSKPWEWDSGWWRRPADRVVKDK